MLNASQIKGLHIEKSKAGLSDAQYRQILHEVCDVESSKDESLSESDYWLLVKAIKAVSRSRYGWKPSQLSRFRKYASYCKLGDSAVRQELFKLTGQMHEESLELTNDDFEHVMASLEDRLARMVALKEIEAPAGIELDYWSKRLPNGKLTSRQRYEITGLWEQLKTYLTPERQTFAYLYGFAQSCLRLKSMPGDLGELSRKQGVILVDALKRRLAQEIQHLAKAVPF